MTIRGLDDYITGHYGEDQFKHSCPRCGATCHCDGADDETPDAGFVCAHKCPPEREYEPEVEAEKAIDDDREF